MSREWTQRDYQKSWFTGNLKEEKNEAIPREPEGWNIYSHEWKRSKNGRMEQSKAMEYESRKALSDILKPRNIYIYIYIYIHLTLGRAHFLSCSFQFIDYSLIILYFCAIL